MSRQWVSGLDSRLTLSVNNPVVTTLPLSEDELPKGARVKSMLEPASCVAAAELEDEAA